MRNTRLTPRDANRQGHSINADMACIKPATKSMFESSLHYRDQWVMPEIKGLQHLQDSLDGDARMQRRKYCGGEPTGDSASFTVRLPQGPQHSKFCHTPRLLLSEQPLSHRSSVNVDEPAALHSSPSPKSQRRFSKKEVLHYFRDIDRDGSGFVTKRQAIVYLQKQFKTYDIEQFVAAAKRLDISSREESQMTFGAFLNVFRESGLLTSQQSQAELMYSCSDLGVEGDSNHKRKSQAHVCENMAMEIRLRIGPSEEARFRKNKRAGTLDVLDDDNTSLSLSRFALPQISRQQHENGE